MKRFLNIWFIFFLTLAGCNTDKGQDPFVPSFEVYALLPTDGLGDRSFTDVVYEGIEEAKKDFEFRVKYVIPESQDSAEAWIARIPELRGLLSKPMLVIIAGNQYVEALNRLSGNFGICKILLLARGADEYPGLASVAYRTYAASYIGGYLSAGLVPGCHATVVEAFDAPFLKDYEAGFTQGVIDAGGEVNPPVYLSGGFEGFSMPDSAYRLAKDLMPGNELIFALSAGSNFGIINAARNYSDQRYVIGVDADQSWMGLTVVSGSIIILYGLEIREYISAFSVGSFQSGTFVRALDEGKASFLMNSIVMGSRTVPAALLKTAIEKEKAVHF